MHWHEGSYQLAKIAVVKPTRNLAPSIHDERWGFSCCWPDIDF